LFPYVCSNLHYCSVADNNNQKPVRINAVGHISKPDSSFLKVTYITEDNTGKKFVSIKGDENNHKFRSTATIIRRDSSGHKYKILVGNIPAEFPGGTSAWLEYLKTHLRSGLGYYVKIPEGEVSAKQTVNVEFTIDSLGNTSDITVLNANEVHPKLAEEAIRVIKKSPKWNPGLQEAFAFPDGATSLHKINIET
jgi:hypothetical protein